jgi:transcriptional regulator with XRE-family HTH domain
MLHENPLLRRRLLRSARLLLDWSQARLACEAGFSTSTIHAVESGRLSGAGPVAEAIEAALARGGVQFVAATGSFGPGLRYASSQIQRQVALQPRQGHQP